MQSDQWLELRVFTRELAVLIHVSGSSFLIQKGADFFKALSELLQLQ
jgi:hypothetical protein